MANSCSSADFSTEDYRSTEIEVVLETLFDDDRLHLTEKILRPIACRQPFLLAATHGSLKYLRSYGFRTFDAVWDESYDLIEDPYNRMQAIINVMLDICSWSEDQRRVNTQHIEKIVDHNQKYFFSKDFFDHITDELKTNMRDAFDQITMDPGFDKWVTQWQPRLQMPEIQAFMNINKNTVFPDMNQYDRILELIKQYPKKTVATHKE
jgi:hypothetical protein